MAITTCKQLYGGASMARLSQLLPVLMFMHLVVPASSLSEYEQNRVPMQPILRAKMQQRQSLLPQDVVWTPNTDITCAGNKANRAQMSFVIDEPASHQHAAPAAANGKKHQAD